MPLVFGLSFQMPLVMLFTSKIGVMDAAFFRGKRRIAIFLIAVFAVIVVPSGDLGSIFLLCGPMWVLYELGIWMCIWQARADEKALKAAEADESIEV